MTTPPAPPVPGTDTGDEYRLAYVQLVAPHILDDTTMMESLGLANMRDICRAHDKVLSGEVVETHREPVVAHETENDDGLPVAYWVGLGTPLAGDKTEAEAYMVRWEAEAADPITDPDPIVGTRRDDGTSRGDLPEADRGRGGQVLFKHGIPDALVYAYRADDTTVGYLFAVEIDAGEHQVEVVPGTAYLVAEPDPEADDE